MIPDRPLRISFVGDVALGGPFLERARPKGAPLTYPFEPLRGVFKDTDILVANLEGPLSTEGPPRPGRTALLHNDPAVMDWLATFPLAVCCLANNHLADYGDGPLRRTLELLAERGILAVGAGMTQEAAEQPLIFTLRDQRIGILAFTTDESHVGSVVARGATPGACGLSAEVEAAHRVRILAGSCDTVVVLLHMGFEYFRYPTPEQVRLTRSLADAGATIIVGHHPHVQQGIEAQARGLICHSLGNLILPEMMGTHGRIQYRKPYSKQFALLHVQLAKSGLSGWSIQGGRCDRKYRLLPYEGAAAARFADAISTYSEPLGRPDYPDFWKSYRPQRMKELRREGVTAALTKLLRTPPNALFQTISWHDVKRNLRRIAGKPSSAT